jgi:hypothetical protein
MKPQVLLIPTGFVCRMRHGCLDRKAREILQQEGIRRVVRNGESINLYRAALHCHRK